MEELITRMGFKHFFDKLFSSTFLFLVSQALRLYIYYLIGHWLAGDIGAMVLSVIAVVSSLFVMFVVRPSMKLVVKKENAN